MANEFIIKNGFISKGDGQVDNNLNVTGDVGIGTTSPSEKLHVSGNTKISGSLNIGNILGNTPIGNLGFDSSGNVVTGTTGFGTGVFGISNSLGVYTYYSTLQSAINASNSGDTIQMFADVLETSATTVILKDGVDINMNGYTYTLSQTSSDQCLSDNNVAVNCKIYNGNISRSGSTYVNDVTSLCLYIQNSSSVIETSGVYFTTTTTTGINNNGTIKGAIINAYTRGIVNSGKIYSVNATTTLETAIYCNTTTSEVYDSIGRSNGAGYGIGMLIPSFNGLLTNSVGYSLGNAGIYATNLSTMQSCVGYSVSNNGISVTASIVHDCKGYSSGGVGFNLQNTILGVNVLGYSFTSQGVFVGVPTNLVDSVIDNLTSTSATNSGCALSASGTATLTVKNIQATSLLSGGLGYACTVGGNNNIRIMGGSLDVVNSAVCLYSSSPITVRYANLIFKTSASPEVDANITQGITTPIDSYGNINVLT